MEIEARYLRLTFLKGHPGVWEMKVYGSVLSESLGRIRTFRPV